MATVNDTLSRTQSKPEKVAKWLFTTSGNYRQILGFLLIAALTIISIRFNYELGKLSAVDATSGQLLPAGYALLDLCALFLSGFVGIKSRSFVRKVIAWVWFGVLLSLSLWAAASFTLSVDSRLANTDLTHAIEQKQLEVESLNIEVTTWRINVAQAVNFKTKHQNTLNGVQSRQSVAAKELHALETSLIAPTMAIYHKAAPYTPFDADTLSLIVRLIWAGAMTLSPLVIVLLVVAEFDTTAQPIPQPCKTKLTKNTGITNRWSSWKKSAVDWSNCRKMRRVLATAQTATLARDTKEQTQAHTEMKKNKALQPKAIAPIASHITPITGHNQHTRTLDLNGLQYAMEWIAKQPQGRVTRAKLSYAAKVRTREGVTRIIDALIDRRILVRVGNGQLYKAQENTP